MSEPTLFDDEEDPRPNVCPFYDNGVECVRDSARGGWIPRLMVDFARSEDEERLASFATMGPVLMEEASARALRREIVKEWEPCPQCGSKKTAYIRSMNHDMGAFLLALARETIHSGEEWHHMTDLPVERGGDAAKVFWWGMAAPKYKHPDATHKTESGLWRLSPTGMAFVLGKVRLPRYALEAGLRSTDEGRWVLGYTGQLYSIADTLRTPFDFQDILGMTAGTLTAWLAEIRARDMEEE